MPFSPNIHRMDSQGQLLRFRNSQNYSTKITWVTFWFYGACLLYFLEITSSLLTRLFAVIAYKILIQKYIVNLNILL